MRAETINKTVNEVTFPELLSIDKTAARLSLSSWTIRAMVRDGRLGSCKIGTRVLIPCSEITRLIAEGTRPALEK
ncbi:MAG TPA: helix-turn-helix domain-containing protein [Blastocatellia bacterium]|nr:helix-turn-helix domain-containing protein [Blastocatellia bacterium]